MQKVFPVLTDPLFQRVLKDPTLGSSYKSEAVIGKILAPGRYIVFLKDGTSLSAVGPEGLEKGSKVQIASMPSRSETADPKSGLSLPSGKSEGWLAKFPVKLPSGTSEVKLQMYVEGDRAGLFGKKDPVVRFVFTVKTAVFGQIQWGVYLRQNEVLTQVYFEKMGSDKSEIARIIKEFEDSLKKKGFSLLAPTVILKRPLKASAGLQLDLQG